jgi:hypothetical protein
MHELSDGREDGGDGLIVRGELFVEPGLELRESACQFFGLRPRRGSEKQRSMRAGLRSMRY